MTDLDVRLRRDLPRLAELLVDAPAAPITRPVGERGATGGRGPRRRRTRQVAFVACGAALLIAAVAVFAVSQRTSSHVNAPAGPTPDVTVPSTTDTELPLGALETGPIPSGQYLYIRTSGFGNTTVAAAGGVTYTYVTPNTHEMWIGADGSGRIRTTNSDARFLTPENEQAFFDAGLVLPEQRRPNDIDRLEDPGEMAFEDLSQLPTDHAALAARLDDATFPDPSIPGYAAQLMETISDWSLSSWPTAPRVVRQSLVAVLRDTPGMTTEIVDGMTVISAPKGGTRTEFWFDGTASFRRRRSIITDATIAHGLRASNGTVTSDTVVEAAAIVPSTNETR